MGKVSLFAAKTAAQTATGDLFPLLDVSETGDDQNSIITRAELAKALLENGEATKLVLTGGTATSSTPLFSSTQTWNGAGVFHADTMDVTNMLSGSGSTLIQRKLGGSTLFEVTKTGRIWGASDLVLQGTGGVTEAVRVIGDFQAGALFMNDGNVQIIANASSHVTFTCVRLIINALPTSSAGLAAGTLWNDTGTVKVA